MESTNGSIQGYMDRRDYAIPVSFPVTRVILRIYTLLAPPTATPSFRSIPSPQPDAPFELSRDMWQDGDQLD